MGGFTSGLGGAEAPQKFLQLSKNVSYRLLDYLLGMKIKYNLLYNEVYTVLYNVQYNVRVQIHVHST